MYSRHRSLTAETVRMMKFTHARTLIEAVDMAAERMPQADVAISRRAAISYREWRSYSGQ